METPIRSSQGGSKDVSDSASEGLQENTQTESEQFSAGAEDTPPLASTSAIDGLVGIGNLRVNRHTTHLTVTPAANNKFVRNRMSRGFFDGNGRQIAMHSSGYGYQKSASYAGPSYYAATPPPQLHVTPASPQLQDAKKRQSSGSDKYTPPILQVIPAGDSKGSVNSSVPTGNSKGSTTSDGSPDVSPQYHESAANKKDSDKSELRAPTNAKNFPFNRGSALDNPFRLSANNVCRLSYDIRDFSGGKKSSSKDDSKLAPVGFCSPTASDWSDRMSRRLSTGGTNLFIEPKKSTLDAPTPFANMVAGRPSSQRLSAARYKALDRFHVTDTSSCQSSPLSGSPSSSYYLIYNNDFEVRELMLDQLTVQCKCPVCCWCDASLACRNAGFGNLEDPFSVYKRVANGTFWHEPLTQSFHQVELRHSCSLYEYCRALCEREAEDFVDAEQIHHSITSHDRSDHFLKETVCRVTVDKLGLHIVVKLTDDSGSDADDDEAEEDASGAKEELDEEEEKPTERLLTFGWGAVVASRVVPSTLADVSSFEFADLLIVFQEYINF